MMVSGSGDATWGLRSILHRVGGFHEQLSGSKAFFSLIFFSTYGDSMGQRGVFLLRYNNDCGV